MKYGPKKDRSPLTRLQRYEARQNMIAKRMEGTGRYKFKNNTAGSLNLLKPAEDGRRTIPVGGDFIGDSYHMAMVPQHLIILEDLNVKNENKLITEQPPVVTNEGTVEYVQQQKQAQKLHEGKVKQPEVLLTEDPVGGVVIMES